MSLTRNMHMNVHAHSDERTQTVNSNWTIVQPTDHGLTAQATEYAAKAAEQSPISVAFCKELIHVARDATIPQGLVDERSKFVELFSTEDQREGVNAFLEKRAPEWKNA